MSKIRYLLFMWCILVFGCSRPEHVDPAVSATLEELDSCISQIVQVNEIASQKSLGLSINSSDLALLDEIIRKRNLSGKNLAVLATCVAEQLPRNYREKQYATYIADAVFWHILGMMKELNTDGRLNRELRKLKSRYAADAGSSEMWEDMFGKDD